MKRSKTLKMIWRELENILPGQVPAVQYIITSPLGFHHALLPPPSLVLIELVLVSHLVVTTLHAFLAF